MKLNKILLALIMIFAISSCKEEKKTDETFAQMKRVMAIHDEVMPKMGVMGKLAGELSSKEDSTALGMQYKNARRDLQDARKSMMKWMEGFGNRFTSDEIMNGAVLNEQKKLWLNEEEEKVKALKEQINSGIENAETLLRANKD